MENSLFHFLFAQDLMEYTLKLNDFTFKLHDIASRFREKIGDSPFRNEIGGAVVALIETHSNMIEACSKELSQKCFQDETGGYLPSEKFRYMAMEAAVFYFPQGYTPVTFLCFCAMVLGCALNLFKFPSNGIPEYAAEVVAIVLTSHQLTGQFNKQGGWNVLREISRKYIKYHCVAYYDEEAENMEKFFLGEYD